jgi:hypothetical protein
MTIQEQEWIRATWDFFVCDYDPPGNIGGQPPY